MSRYSSNPQRTKFLASFEEIRISTSDIQGRCRFNFSYFDDTQDAGIAFSDLDAAGLSDLFDKLKAFSKSSLNFWRNERCGGNRGLRMFSDYGNFPENSDFSHPKFVPVDARWGRFRLENMFRLVGFTIPPNLAGQPSGKDGATFDLNTFYVVFLDPEHRFYKSESR